MYKLTSAIDLSSGRPALMVPVFTTDRTNVPYGQITDEYLYVENFLPIYKLGEYESIFVDTDFSTRVGERSIIVFREPCGDIFCGNISDLHQYVDNFSEQLKSFPLLDLQLHRLIAAESNIVIDLITRASQAYFTDQDQRVCWLKSSIALTQKNEHIWKLINSAVERKYEKISIPGQSHGEFDFEYYIDALSKTKFFDAANLESIWFRLLEHSPLDQRVFDVGIRWIYYKYSSNFSDAFNVFCAVVSNVETAYVHYNFVEFLHDLVGNNEIFSEAFDVPANIAMSVIRLVANESSPADTRDLIIDMLKRNYFHQTEMTFYCEILAACIKAAGIGSDVNRESIQKHVLPALNLLNVDGRMRPIIKIFSGPEMKPRAS